MDKPKITCSNDVFQLFHHLREYPYEEFWIVVLNKANRVIDRVKISEGGIAGTVVEIRRIFLITINLLGASLILLHNHPSGNIQPSVADITIT